MYSEKEKLADRLWRYKNRDSILKKDAENYIKRRAKLGKIVKPQINKVGSIVKYCTVCKVQLDDLNWDKDNKKDRLYHCNNCWRVHDRDQARKYTLQTYRNGKLIYLRGNKQDYPMDQKCTLCGRVTKKLDYHHWNDRDISKGIWMCYLCNQMSDRIERKLHLKYLELKEEIELGKKT